MAVHEIDCNGPGIRRIGAGKGFYYRDPDGVRADDEEVIARVKALAIPPAWRDVWICSDPQGHIQATGLDEAGRRQYLYHEEWQARRATEKFERVGRFARRLPSLRQQVDEHLARSGLPRDKVLAAAVRLLEMGCFRVGGETYAEENGSYGLATLRKEHVRRRGDRMVFDFPAKSGQRQRIEVSEPVLVEVLTALKRRRAPAQAELLAYRDDEGRWVDVRSEDVNAYLHEALGEGCSAKDFRTWVATVLSAVALADRPQPESSAEYRRTVVAVVAEVADHLGNTPAVARSAYIDPRVLERFEADDTLDEIDAGRDLESIEAEVMALVRRSR